MKNNSNSSSGIKSLFRSYHSTKAEISPENRRNIQSMLGNILSDKTKVKYQIFEKNNINYMFTTSLTSKHMIPDILENISGNYLYDNAILYCHGGGYVIGDISYCKILSSKLAIVTDIPVLSFEYPLAPEHPYPAQLDAAVDACTYLLSLAKNITIVGESAGGHLAITLFKKMQLLYPEEIKRINSIVCMSPWTDLTLLSESYELKKETDPILSFEAVENFRENFAPNMDYYDPLLSPIFMDFTGFPPVLIQVGSNEILVDDSINLHECLKDSGVKSYFSAWYDYWHIFQTFPDGLVPAAGKAIFQVKDFIFSNLHKVGVGLED